MNLLSRTITGIAMVVVGLILIGVAIFKVIFLLIYGIPILVIGLIIFFNKNEDRIEGIKLKGGRK
jgi:membrane-bound ClpP family serine protease